MNYIKLVAKNIKPEFYRITWSKKENSIKNLVISINVFVILGFIIITSDFLFRHLISIIT